MDRDLVEVVEILDHPRDRLWAAVTDIESYPRFVREISWCGRLDLGQAGMGRRYDVRFSIDDGPVSRNEVTVLVYRRPEQMVLVSRNWPGGHVAVRLNPLGPKRTELQLTISLPKLRYPTVITSKWLRKRARSAIQLVDDHLSGRPVTAPPRRLDQAPNSRRRPRVAKVLTKAGVLTPNRPALLVRQLTALARFDATVPGAYRASLGLAPGSEAITDEVGVLSFADVESRTNRLANALAEYEVRHGRRVVLLCRNHGALVESVIACGKLGAHVLLLDTELTADQVTEAIRRYRPAVMLVDDEFAGLTRSLPPALPRVWTTGEGTTTVNGLIECASARRTRSPSRGKIIVLSSGQAPNSKGARRRNLHTLRTVAAVLTRMPLREGEPMLVAAPLFHSWAGLAAMQLGMPLHAKVVLQRRFDAEATLRLVEQHRCASLFVVPSMVQRIMDLPQQVRRKYDTSSLRVVASSGHAMPAPLVTAFMDEFGDVLYHLYGSTDVAWVCIGDPKDLRAAPTTVGRPLAGTRIDVLDTRGRPVPPGVVGRICVGDDTLFEGYPGRVATGEDEELLRTGDRGYQDADGRLFVAGRDTLVMPGEEVFLPCPLEQLLLTLPQVEDAAVVNVRDREFFGQRLAAYVALRPGATLTAAAVRDFLRAHLPRFAVLRDVIFVDSLARNATAKVMRRLLTRGELSTGVPE